MNQANVSSFELVKTAISSKKDIIIIEGLTAVKESVDYFQTIKVAGRIGTLGIVAGLFVWPLLVIGVGEKIVTHSAKSYVYIANENLNCCLLMRKSYLNEIFLNLPRVIKKMKKACGLSDEDIAGATHLSVSQVKKVLHGGMEEMQSEVGMLVLEYIDKQYCTSGAIIADSDKEIYEKLNELSLLMEKYGFIEKTSTIKKHPNVGKGFMKIHKTHEAVYKNMNGRLVWDWALYNEISFEDYATAKKYSLFKGDLLAGLNPLKKTEDAEIEFQNLVAKYGIIK